MRALLDTSTFLWIIADSERLSVNARNYIADLNNELFISVASLWEIAIKTSLEKLTLLKPFEQLIPEQLEENSIFVLPIGINHLTALTEMPFHHRDPFDRLIIAQANKEFLPVITSDRAFRQYEIDVIW